VSINISWNSKHGLPDSARFFSVSFFGARGLISN
jgi:hypothetical protein